MLKKVHDMEVIKTFPQVKFQPGGIFEEQGTGLA
jgi:hypothetical protein